ncbi:MAG: ABC transporter substrate-binding protein, partial [Candidatus Hodarchaeales archaeon]
TATASTLSNRTLHPYFLRIVSSTKDDAMALADFVQVTNWTQGATLHSDDLFSSDAIQDFIDIFEERNGTILTEQSFTTGDTDVDSQILAIKNAAPEFVVATFVDPPNAVELEVKAQGIENLTWIGGALTTDKALGLGNPPGPAFEAFNLSWFDPAWNWLEGPAYSQSTGSAFDYPGGGLTPHVYDAVYVAAKGLAAAGTTDGIALTEALYEVKHEGASQIIEFNDIGEMWGRFNYIQFENNVSSIFGEWFGTPYIENTLTLADGTILTLDTIAPDLSIDSPLAQTYQTDAIAVTLSGDAVHYWYFVEPIDSQNHTWTTSVDRTLLDGLYVLHAYGNDSVGNIAYVPVTFTIDTTPPSVTLISPLAQIYGTDTITVALSGNASHYWYYIESVDSQNQTWTTSVDRTLTDGTYTLHMYGNDSVGNIAHVPVTFTISTTTTTTTTSATTTPTTTITPSWSALLFIIALFAMLSWRQWKKKS